MEISTPVTGDESSMGDEGEIWNRVKEQRQVKRWDNVDKSLAILKEKGIRYETLNSSVGHYRIGDWNFWPTTGKFYNPKTGKKGRGVFNLIRYIKQ